MSKEFPDVDCTKGANEHHEQEGDRKETEEWKQWWTPLPEIHISL